MLGALRRDDLLRRVTDTSDLAGDETDGTADLTDDIEEIADTEQELGDLQNSDTEINSIDDQVRRTYLRVDPFTQLKLSDRNRLRLQYSFALRDYSSDGQRLRDSTRHTLSAQFSRDMSERDTLLAGVSASAFEPDDLRNSEYYQATVGWRHRPTQTTRLEGELGLTHVDSTGVSDTGVMIRLAGRAQMRFGKLSAELRRTVVPNAFGTVVETDHIRMQLQTDLGRRWRSKSELLYIGRETDEATSSDRDQVRFRQQFRRTINRNLSLAASYQYRWVDRTPNRWRSRSRHRRYRPSGQRLGNLSADDRETLMNADIGHTDVAGYWGILKRRKWSFVMPFLLIAGIGAALAFLLPPAYRSEATILIERQSIPTDFVDTTVTGYVQEQIEQIRQRISTFENLIDIARKHNLHTSHLEIAPRETVRKVAEGISVRTVNVTTTDPDQRGERKATIAFTVSFTSEDPRTARAVTNELATRYLQEHRLLREERAQQVSEFLGAGATALREELTELEAQLADFKQDSFEELPELMNMNLKLLENAENGVALAENRVRQYGDQLRELESELSLTPPYNAVQDESGRRLQSASERLSALTAQYLTKLARYSTKHPDVIKLSREIRVLAEQSGTGARADEILNQLANQQDRLRSARQTYGPDHPEVTSLEKAVAALQRGLQGSIIAGPQTTPDIPPDNPRYVSLQSQISTVRSNLSAERETLNQQRQKADEYRERLIRTPLVDRDLRALTLDYDNTRQKYRELTQKLREAELAEELEQGGNAERFELVSGAFLPKLPESPNRIGILALSVLLASVAGLLMVSISEYFDKTVRGIRSVVANVGQPPLVTIPELSRIRAVLPAGFVAFVVSGGRRRG